jgi:hypothetical protein
MRSQASSASAVPARGDNSALSSNIAHISSGAHDDWGVSPDKCWLAKATPDTKVEWASCGFREEIKADEMRVCHS